ncbi:MAG TPA: cellulose synthase catalytic subunit [Acidimicrobiales bacterium]|nr:cellulose synthase catalytic subunit [Acidimicrobiales bacterium]
MLFPVLGTVSAGAYLWWLVQPSRIGHPALYALLLVVELFNITQAIAFWVTTARGRLRRRRPAPLGWLSEPEVDVFVPVYDEPVEVVRPTLQAALALRGRANVWLLDDACREELQALAIQLGVGYLPRRATEGAKAGNINHALARTSAPFVVILDCDHVPRPELLERTLPHLTDPEVAYVQTPQHYANADANPVAEAAWGQQALFFGPIAVGKDAFGAMFCCGTNVVFRREALESVGGFPTRSVTEDFELSIHLHEQGWRSLYVPEVLASGYGPDDMSGYVSQQLRWARGCLSALPRVVRSSLPFGTRLQYLLSSGFFLTGWTFLVYMSMPVLRILTGAQPIAAAGADQFLLAFLPYFGLALAALAATGAGAYGFGAYSLLFASWWVHVSATIAVLRGRPGRFVVTPKGGEARRQPRAVLPALLCIAALVAVGIHGLLRDRSPATLNNVAFLVLHIVVLWSGAVPALRAPAAASSTAGHDTLAADAVAA